MFFSERFESISIKRKSQKNSFHLAVIKSLFKDKTKNLSIWLDKRSKISVYFYAVFKNILDKNKVTVTMKLRAL